LNSYNECQCTTGYGKVEYDDNTGTDIATCGTCDLRCDGCWGPLTSNCHSCNAAGYAELVTYTERTSASEDTTSHSYCECMYGYAYIDGAGCRSVVLRQHSVLIYLPICLAVKCATDQLERSVSNVVMDTIKYGYTMSQQKTPQMYTRQYIAASAIVPSVSSQSSWSSLLQLGLILPPTTDVVPLHFRSHQYRLTMDIVHYQEHLEFSIRELVTW